jgi:hypothetical protein
MLQALNRIFSTIFRSKNSSKTGGVYVPKNALRIAFSVSERHKFIAVGEVHNGTP